MKQKLFTKNFSLLVLGQVSSLFGNFILKFALAMHILEVTGSAAVYAGILAVAAVPPIFLSPLGGILADRINRRNIMVTLDALSGTAVLAASFFLTGQRNITAIAVLLVILSILGAFESPTVQASVPQMLTGDNVIRGNAVVNQVAAVAALAAPILGSVFYTAFGLRPVIYASVLCFYITALLECFIKLEKAARPRTVGILATVKEDFKVSMQFIGREHPEVLKLLLLSAVVSFFVIGTAVVGFPFLVRTVLGLSAEHYGAAESVIGLAAILGSTAAGLLTGKLKTRKLAAVLAIFGISLIPSGIIFLIPSSAFVRYIVTTAAFCGVQIAACIFSVFALSMIQQKTPNHLTGKVMAYIATITMCAQPLGQIVYGVLFDAYSSAVYLVLLPTAILVSLIGSCSRTFFRRMEEENKVEN